MIRTARLLLRDARESDLADLHAIFGDPRAMRYWDRPAHGDIAETRAVLDELMAPNRTQREDYVLEFEGRCIGKAGLWRAPQLGYILHPDAWGQGLMTEALAAILPRCWSRFPQMPAILAELDPRNAASIRLLDRFGFTRTALRQQDFLYGGTTWCDTAVYTLPRPA
ncbi:GNAT family N-acetyltransferase [Tropicibacter sp. S64]|uniref:GNAT family N-acetyltransferase n=1 Tax=Tropicibacter sp. S64 TaxID=3415122 RepID=UPI003C7E2A79